MTTLERDVRRRHRNVGERPWQHFGVCASCGSTRDDDGRPLWVTGRRRGRLICLECFDLSPTRRRAA